VKDSEDVNLSNLVRQLRETKGWTQTQMAAQLVCAPSHIWAIEHRKPRRRNGGWVPSEEFLRKLCAVCAESPEAEVELLRRLLLARSREIVPMEVRCYLSDEVLLAMPDAFLSRLRVDMGKLSAEDVTRVDQACRLSGRLLLVLRGLGRLTPFEVALLAKELGQSVDQYLFAAGYMSEGMKMLVKEYEGCVNLLEVVAGLSPATRRELESFREKVVGLGQGKEPVQ